jgi:glutamate-5-semialdehyde dehydrogenase
VPTLIAMSVAPQIGPLTELTAGQPLVFGGDRIVAVPADLAAAFRPGDRLVVVQSTGALLHIPAAEQAVVDAAVGAAVEGFNILSACSDEAITEFFDRFAGLLESDGAFAPVSAANSADVERARERGRSTTRLTLDAAMRAGMVAGLRGWRDSPNRRDALVETVEHAGWSVEARRAPLGVVGFVFEGRPNVFADACGVVRTGNAVVFRIGSDALGTARAIVEHALRPALLAAGLPAGIVQLVDSPAHAAGHALFGDRRLALAVARGSGEAVAQLGAVASQSGIPVSLHGTGGGWIVAGQGATAAGLRAAVEHSLDRKVCNTLNVCVIPADRADELVPAFLAGLDAASDRRGVPSRLHVVAGSQRWVPQERFDSVVDIRRSAGITSEPAADSIPVEALATEWEWEDSPEVTLMVLDGDDAVGTAIDLFDRYSPHFVASMVSALPEEHDRFYASVDAPFVGNGFTRWVDGQYALDKPELGLSNWQGGRLLGRGAILSGDSVHTVRHRARITDDQLRR